MPANTPSMPKWLVELFEFEYCGECGGDDVDHIPCDGPFGLPFAMCKFAPLDRNTIFRHGVVSDAS